MGKVSSVPSFARQERLALEREQEEEQGDGMYICRCSMYVCMYICTLYVYAQSRYLAITGS